MSLVHSRLCGRTVRSRKRGRAETPFRLAGLVAKTVHKEESVTMVVALPCKARKIATMKMRHGIRYVEWRIGVIGGFLAGAAVSSRNSKELHGGRAQYSTPHRPRQIAVIGGGIPDLGWVRQGTGAKGRWLRRLIEVKRSESARRSAGRQFAGVNCSFYNSQRAVQFKGSRVIDLRHLSCFVVFCPVFRGGCTIFYIFFLSNGAEFFPVLKPPFLA